MHRALLHVHHQSKVCIPPTTLAPNLLQSLAWHIESLYVTGAGSCCLIGLAVDGKLSGLPNCLACTASTGLFIWPRCVHKGVQGRKVVAMRMIIEPFSHGPYATQAY